MGALLIFLPTMKFPVGNQNQKMTQDSAQNTAMWGNFCGKHHEGKRIILGGGVVFTSSWAGSEENQMRESWKTGHLE